MRILIFIGIVFQTFTLHLSAQDIFFERISPETGFAFNAISSITEDDNGLLWFSCNNRIYHYNTSTIEEYSLSNDSNAINNPIVYGTIQTKNGILISTTSGLYLFDTEKKEFKKIEIYFPDATNATNASFTILERLNDDQIIVVINQKGYVYTEGKKILTALNTDNKIRHISHIHCTNDKIAIGTMSGKVFVMNKDLSEYKEIYTSKKDYIRTICKDGNKYLIGFHNGGIEVIDLLGNYIEAYSVNSEGNKKLPSNMIRQIIRRDNGEIWIGTFKGLVIKNGSNLQSMDYESGRGLPHSSIYLLEKGKDGGIWVGTWAGGIGYYRDCNYKFNHINPRSKHGTKTESAITAFIETEDHTLWIASEKEGDNLFQSPLKNISSLPAQLTKSPLNNLFIKDIKQLSKNQLAIIDFNEGLIIYDLKNNRFKQTKSAFKEKGIELGNITERLAINDNKIWVFNDKLCSYNQNGEVEVYALPDDPSQPSRIRGWHLYFDSAHNLWVCTSNGLYIKHKNSPTLQKCLKGQPLENKSLYTCCEDKNGQIWLGTAGEGIHIYHPETDTTSIISADKMIHELDVYSIIKGQNNDMWFSSNKGVFHYTNDNKIFQYTDKDGLSGLQFKPNAGYMCSNGQILFGTINSYNIITPNIIKTNTAAPQVLLSEFIINNEKLTKDNCIDANAMDIYKLKDITLKKSQNTINLKVICNNYINPSKNRFKYRLVNYNNKWTEIPNNTSISYTKIPSGNYTLEVFGSNNDNIWSEEPYTLNISVLPALWQRWYFILLYLIATGAISFFITTNIRSKIALKKSIKDEKQRSKLNESIHQERVKFFVNISHELRTPLTLILSPIQALLTKYEHDTNTSKLLKTIDRNSQRLLRLTDQTLDFRLLEMGKLKPKLKKTDLIQLAIDSYTYFEQRILEREINFSFYSDFKSLNAMIDPEMVEKIIFNLVSNAIDFTNADGHVKLSVRKKRISIDDYTNIFYSGNQHIGPCIEIKVEDSGIGINPDNLPDLFRRFTKASDINQSKTGIGLHLCSEYAALNDGNIMVKTATNTGSTFTLILPFKDETEYESKQQQYIISPKSQSTEKYDLDDTTEDFNNDLEENINKTLLIIDNNKELLLYLKKYFKSSFRVTTATNHAQAFKVIEQLHPDIILTEITLPDSDNYTHIEQIKNHKALKNTPIIVLTQLTEKQHQINCLQLGVEAFLNKPIEDALLLAQVNNIAKKLITKKESQTTNNAPTRAKSIASGHLDGTTFTAIAEQLVLDNLQNITFDANTLASKMDVSYSTFFRRIKRETGISATQFIRDIRLKKAVRLLKESDLSIDEIGTSIGFNSTSYFVRSFKKRYDKTPSEFRKLG